MLFIVRLMNLSLLNNEDLMDITMKESVLCKVKFYPSCHYICKLNIICN